jgi:hypothetical protein
MIRFVKLINFSAGLLLLILGVSGYFSPEWFFTEKYDVLMPSVQSHTILRVMMGFMTTIGIFWIIISQFYSNQKQFLLFTAALTFGFIISRVGGLFIDGFDQYFTYIELGFELVALTVILAVYFMLQKETEY